MGATPLLLATVLACVTLSQAYVTLEVVAIKPGHENQCWVKSKKAFFPSGSIWFEDDVCERGFCSGGGTQIERQGCGSIGVPDGCTLETPAKELKLPYPDCCPAPKCP